MQDVRNRQITAPLVQMMNVNTLSAIAGGDVLSLIFMMCNLIETHSPGMAQVLESRTPLFGCGMCFQNVSIQ